MRCWMYAACGTSFPFAMTALGAAAVFCFRRTLGERPLRMCMGFAAGVMLAASVFSLLIPAADQIAQRGGTPWLVLTLGFALGAAALAMADAALSRLRRGRHMDASAHRRTLLMGAVALHNVPEGMAVGLAFALAAQQGAPLAAPIALALGIGIQNLPEGAAIALPLRQGGMSRARSFAWGALSGAVEPVFGVLCALAAPVAGALLPWLMAFAAGAMLWVIFGDMLPEAAQDRLGVAMSAAGFALMMALDVALG